ncbi:hypothetical protein OCK74_20665 [Chitinophagaceae bacterium LB-8]|uniref:Uncharacterized protein n=1 Tax=Paraflavisolibacter caeni TaxID=2982496 RepID=A0A9X2XY40_9BACT|nr:hypothetical protein [Paraflavisolibacter caeni]MCU7551546.1 hypothetical protein [Paraflavisolibacter caeni]
MKIKIFFPILLFLSSITYSQNIVGFWYGNANITNGGSANNYLIELILKQNQGNVQGILNYYFRNTFRSIQLNGSYNPTTRKLALQNIPITYFASTSTMEVDCMMDFIATLRVAQAGSILNGTFMSKKEYRATCPEISFNLALDKNISQHDSVVTAIKEFKEVYQVWQPAPEDTIVAATVIQRPVVNYVVNAQYKERDKVVEKEILVDADSVTVDFYDNGEVDGDSISVFYNDQLITFNRKLSTRSIQFRLGLDPTKEVNEITMFADNLGSIPPNTALMLVNDGKNRFDIRLSSNLQKSATVRLKRKPVANTSSTSGAHP